MSAAGWIYAIATATGAAALWLALPRASGRGRWLGTLLGVVSLGLFGSRLLPQQVSNWLHQIVFFATAAVTVAAAVGAVTFRNPVYCAVWFGLALLGAAGLMFFQGAQFLGVATIVVYAGAILVTLLFVLMLASPRGAAYYDRVSWEAPLSAVTGMVIVGVFTLILGGAVGLEAGQPPAGPAMSQLDNGILTKSHTARLGAELFSRHLIAVEVAGALLLAALVGAVAMIAHTKSQHE